MTLNFAIMYKRNQHVNAYTIGLFETTKIICQRDKNLLIQFRPAEMIKKLQINIKCCSWGVNITLCITACYTLFETNDINIWFEDKIILVQ